MLASKSLTVCLFTVILQVSVLHAQVQVYEEEEYSGSSVLLDNPYQYYYESDLPAGNVASLKLERGYMATLAQNSDGTGISKCYVAQDRDVNLPALTPGLSGEVSFVRVIPWRNTGKKGFTSEVEAAEALNADWWYDWDNNKTSTESVEYVPIRHNSTWPSYENINTNESSTHVLGFNEPDSPDQADMSVDEALEQWPRLLESGLRLGSPAPTDGGLSWLYDFIEKADARDYRVDFVAVHYYRGGNSVGDFHNFLRDVYRNTGRPVWVTEFNNGANWSGPTPTYEEQAEWVGDALEMLNNSPFVERYAIYNWVEDERAVISTMPDELTEAGIVYRDSPSPSAYLQKGIPKSNWSLVYANSEETSEGDGSAVNAFDDDYTTLWHTEWSEEPRPVHPHELQIDLGETYVLTGMRYTPRLYGNLNGTIADYSFYTSKDTAEWGDPVQEGTWESSHKPKSLSFEPDTARYIRLQALSEVNGKEFTSVAEIDLLGERLVEEEVAVEHDNNTDSNSDPLLKAGRIRLDRTGISVDIETGTGPAGLRIYDCAGRCVYRKTGIDLNKGEVGIKFARELSPGVYMVSLESEYYGILREKLSLW